MPLPNPYYIRKQAGLYELQNTRELTPLFIYQPTPAGITALCQHYNQKYKINLYHIDFQTLVESGDNARHFFSFLQQNFSLSAISEGQTTGLILSHGQHHAIPILINKYFDSNRPSMIIFDSSSGSRIKGYYKIANLFPEFDVYLNDGTRQSDGLSCITDAVCILKEALQIKNLLALIRPKVIPEHPAFKKTQFFNEDKPENFNVFNMPEQLLLTAQVSSYVSNAQADLTTILRGGKTLHSYREQFRMEVILLKNGERDFKTINGYLFTKSLEHRNLLDFILEIKQVLGELVDENEPELSTLSPSAAEQGRAETVQSPRFSLSESNLSFYSITDSRNPPTDNRQNVVVSR